MASSSLKLIIEKGPRNGETIEFNSRSKIRIGRVVKGNNLTIKDPGISSKHLEIIFNSDSMNWVITDFDSSNGTIVNTTQLRPLSQFEIRQGDEIKLGESTSIRVEIGEEISTRRNPRRQVTAKVGFNLGEKDGIGDEIGNRKNPRRIGGAEISTDFGGKIGKSSKLEEVDEIREEIDEVRGEINEGGNPKKLGNEVEVLEEGCSNLEGENVEKGGGGNRRGRGRGRPKKDGNVDGGVCESVGNVPVKAVLKVNTRRTSNSKRVEDGLVGLVEPMPTRRTRRVKNVEDVRVEKLGESAGLDSDECRVVESVSVVDDKKARGVRGRRKKVVTESLENVADVTAEEKMNHEVIDLMEQPCDQPVDDPAEQSVKNDQLVEVDVADPKEVFLSTKQKSCPELMGETNHVSAESSESVRDAVIKEKMNHDVFEKEVSENVVDLREQPCDEPVDNATGNHVFCELQNEQILDVEDPEQEGAVLSVGEKQHVELVDEANQQIDSVSLPVSKQNVALGSLLVEEGAFDGVESDAMLCNGRTEDSEIEKESEAFYYGRSKDFGTDKVVDLDNMTLEDWFNFLEVHLPKQIHAAADEIIEGMIKRSKQFDEYVLQQQKEKSKVAGSG